MVAFLLWDYSYMSNDMNLILLKAIFFTHPKTNAMTNVLLIKLCLVYSQSTDNKESMRDSREALCFTVWKKFKVCSSGQWPRPRLQIYYSLFSLKISLITLKKKYLASFLFLDNFFVTSMFDFKIGFKRKTYWGIKNRNWHIQKIITNNK